MSLPTSSQSTQTSSSETLDVEHLFRRVEMRASITEGAFGRSGALLSPVAGGEGVETATRRKFGHPNH